MISAAKGRDLIFGETKGIRYRCIAVASLTQLDDLFFLFFCHDDLQSEDFPHYPMEVNLRFGRKTGKTKEKGLQDFSHRPKGKAVLNSCCKVERNPAITPISVRFQKAPFRGTLTAGFLHDGEATLAGEFANSAIVGAGPFTNV